MFQEFQISVTPLRNKPDEYFIRTEAVAPGVPLSEEQVNWAVEDWLQQARQVMNDPLLQLFESNGNGQGDFFSADPFFANHQEVSPTLLSLGQQLFEALFPGSLRTSWMIAQGIAYNHQATVRLRLILKDRRTSRLPWEILAEGERPLVTGLDVAFSRYLAYPGTRHTAEDTFLPPSPQAKRILMVIAGPSDRETLALQQEAAHLQAELDSSELELHLLSQPGREELTQALEQGQYQIFHYAGHSDLGDTGGDLYLVNRKTGLTETLGGEDVAGLLRNNGIQLAVFNSCRSADTVLESPGMETKQSLTQTLVKHEIPAVLAMVEQIPDEVALTLARLFYRNLSQGYPLDLSLSRARQGLISAYGSHQLYWALPVLYLHPDYDGAIVSPPGEQAEDWLAQEGLTLPEDDFLPSHGRGLDYPPEMETDDDPEAFIKGVLDELDHEETQLQRGTQLQDYAVEPVPVATVEAATPLETEKIDSPPVSPTDWQDSLRTIPKLPLIGVGCAIAIAFFSVVLSLDPAPKVSDVPDITVAEEPVDPPIGDNFNTDTLYQVAIQNIRADNLAVGLSAIQELLDRGALPYAEEALAVVRPEQLDNPQVAFLQGRTNWQYYLQGNPDYAPDDARRPWQVSVSADPRLEALNALGFAYYAEGNYEEANNAWYDALEIAEARAEENPEILQSPEVLTTYAGIALALRQFAQGQSGESAQMLEEKAIKVYNMVMQTAPLQFSKDRLIEDWLWSEDAIATWVNF
jgi:hypothetical protein